MKKPVELTNLLASSSASNHGVQIEATTGYHGRVPRGFDSQGNLKVFRCLGYVEKLAGVAGIEPANADTKNRCLTTWLHPSTKAPI